MTTDHDRRQFLRYTRTENWPMLARHPVAATVHHDLLAGMLAIRPEEVAAGIEALRAEAGRAAADLLADARLRAAIEALPFRAGDRVVAVGDSITADRVGWFEILTAAVTAAGPGGFVLRNLGLSGNTTADVLERFDLLEAARPTHVLLMLGTNDARRHGRTAGYAMATGPETERNLRALVDLVTRDLKAAITLVTPPAVDAPAADTFFAGLPLGWDADAVADIAARVRRIDARSVGLHDAPWARAPGELLEADGVHPTPAGQRIILAAVVRHLAGAADRPAVPAGSSGTAG